MQFASADTTKRRRRRGKSRHKPMSEINVTPFVDVVLILLIIFIVAAPLLTVGVEVRLPESAASALPSEDEEPLSISISKDGSVALQATEISIDELIPRLSAVMAERRSDKIFIRGDRELQYEVHHAGDGSSEQRRVSQHRTYNRSRRSDVRRRWKLEAEVRICFIISLAAHVVVVVVRVFREHCDARKHRD